MLINFTVFTDSVLDHSKPHTIRRFAKRRPPAIGQPLQLYHNARRPYCELLLEVPCIHVQKIHIVHGYGVTLGGVDLTAEQLRRLIYADGFRAGAFKPDPTAFWQFFTPGLGVGEAYEGFLVSWAPHTLLDLGPAPDTLPAWVPYGARHGKRAPVVPALPHHLEAMAGVIEKANADGVRLTVVDSHTGRQSRRLSSRGE